MIELLLFELAVSRLTSGMRYLVIHVQSLHGSAIPACRFERKINVELACVSTERA